MKLIKYSILTLLILSFSFSAVAQKPHKFRKTASKKNTEMVEHRQQMTLWVDSVMGKLSFEDKVAQLMMVRVPSKMNAKQQKDFDKLITDYHVGGVCFFAGTCANQLQQTVRYQKMTIVPLFVSLDAEWRLGIPLNDDYSLPRQMMIGAISEKNDTLIYQMGIEVAKQCNKMGININFAPSVDLNSNPLNPVIGARAFGEDKTRVAAKGMLYAKALQKNGVMAVAKHFPGHGDTDVDSHSNLPVIDHTKAYIDTVDTYPFRRLIRGGVHGVMVGHLQVMSYDNRRNMPASLSEKIINQLLRKQLNLHGLVFTDGLDMKAITNIYKGGEAEIAALMAGVDLLVLPTDVVETFCLAKEKAASDSEFVQLIDLKCRNVLREKYRCGLNELKLDELTVPSKADIHRCEIVSSQIASKALTLVRNEKNILPLQAKDKVLYIAVGNCDTAITRINDSLAARLASAEKVVISLYARSNPTSQNNYGVSSSNLDIIRQIVNFNSRTALVIYGSPYILKYFPVEEKRKTTVDASVVLPQNPIAQSLLPAAIVVAYQDMPEVRSVVPAALRGKTPFEGLLPITIDQYKVGMQKQPSKVRDPYSGVREMGMDVNCFKMIDSIVTMGIEKGAYPGCQILVARNGKIIYNEGYGHQTYEASSPAVDTATIYDLASLTKVTATTFAVMKLVDAGKIKLDDPLSRYLPYLKHTNKKHLTIRAVLSHNARLKAFDSYYKNVDADCANCSLDAHNALRSDNCRDAVMKLVTESDLNKDNKYLYSDLGFMLLADMVRVVSGQTLDIFMQQQFYGPMGMINTTFCPRLHNVDTTRIAPTEKDTYYRHRLLRGEVHDPNAAAMGGVSGHAGLFSTATDIYCLYQMMLDGGVYKNHRYLSTDVIETFNQRYFTNKGNRRALGFDKPLIHGRSTHVASEATQSSYGHTGFTGTMVWVDPKYNLVYIFLSNRVYPDATTNKLAQLDIRTNIQSLIYQSIIKTSKN